MREEHARPGVSHNLLNSGSHGRCIAVDRALAAGRFAFLKGTGPQSFVRVIKQLNTVWAERLQWLVVVGAVSSDHERHGLGFAPHAPVQQ